MYSVTITLTLQFPATLTDTKEQVDEKVVTVFARYDVVATVEHVPDSYVRGSIIDGKLVCPHCQHNGSEENGGYFEHVEDALIWRRLVVERGVLRANGAPDVDYDSSCNPRLFLPKVQEVFWGSRWGHRDLGNVDVKGGEQISLGPS